MANTTVLDLEQHNSADTPLSYADRVEDDRIINSNRDKVDAWAGKVTGSFCTVFYHSGVLSTHLGGHLGNSSEPYGGIAVARENRVITEVQVMAAYSGSGGVSRFDVKKQADVSNVPSTIFSNNVFKPILSASDGAWVRKSTTTFIAGSSSWAKDCALIVQAEAAATVASDVAVVVWWKPSASYGG
jgi:hypothetical protein